MRMLFFKKKVSLARALARTFWLESDETLACEKCYCLTLDVGMGATRESSLFPRVACGEIDTWGASERGVRLSACFLERERGGSPGRQVHHLNMGCKRGREDTIFPESQRLIAAVVSPSERSLRKWVTHALAPTDDLFRGSTPFSPWRSPKVFADTRRDAESIAHVFIWLMKTYRHSFYGHS